jgi:hypothetical protein
MNEIVAATTASVVSRVLLHPLDTLKTLAQTNPRPISLQTLYSGFLPAISLSIPALSLYLVSYDYVKHLIGGNTLISHAVSATTAEVSPSS